MVNLDKEVVKLIKEGFAAEKRNDISQAVTYYERAANKGHSGAMAKLGEIYWQTGDMLKGSEWELKSFINGDTKAIDTLSYMYIKAEGLKDIDRNYIGVIEAFNNAIKNVQDKANDCIVRKKQISLESVTSIFNLGVMHLKGWGPKSEETANNCFSCAYDFYKKFADQGEAKAICRLAYMYSCGYAVESDRNLSIELYKKSADMDDLEALYEVGNALKYGHWIEKNINKAKSFYSRAAELGYIPAMEALYDLCEKEKKWELTKEKSKTGDPSARLNLADMYYQGDGVEKNVNKAVKILEKLVNEGENNTIAYADNPIHDVYGIAAYSLGLFYSDESELKKDFVKARNLFAMASRRGEYDAIKELAQMCKEGKGGKKDESHSEYLLKVASEFADAHAGIVEAEYKVGYKYWEGNFVKENQMIALMWFKRIAERSDLIGSEKEYIARAKKNMKILCKDLRLDEKSLGLVDENPSLVEVNKDGIIHPVTTEEGVLCPHCNQFVKPKKKFSWIWLIVWMVCTGGPIGFFVYVIYYFCKTPKCPLCGEKIKKKS